MNQRTMSEANWALLFLIINGLGMAYIRYLVIKVQAKVNEVAETVNGPFTLALKEIATLRRQRADASGTPEDIAAAETAEAINKKREQSK